MVIAEYKHAIVFLFLSIVLWLKSSIANHTESVTTATVNHLNSILTHKSTEEMEIIDHNESEPWVLITIIATTIAAFFAIVILLIICVYKRRRSERIERDRNLSYNNMNYESTVKFREELEQEGVVLNSVKSSAAPDVQKAKNNARNESGYERVDLPSDLPSSKRHYENVTPRNFKHPCDKSHQNNQQYENVFPVSKKESDAAKTPVGRYEEVFLDSSTVMTKNGDGKRSNDQYYENVELKKK